MPQSRGRFSAPIRRSFGPIGYGLLSLGAGMQRRSFIGTLAGGVFTLSSGARSQPTRRRVGVLISRPQSDLEGKAPGETLLSKLSDAGWRVGHNIDVQIRWCENSDQMRTYTKELVEWPAEVLFAHSAQLVAIAREVTKNTPIVFVVAA